MRTTAKSGLPHDLEHLIVESTLAVDPGLWKLIAAGAEFKSMTVQTQRPRRKPRSVNRDLARRYNNGWAEQVVGQVVGFYRAVSRRGWAPGDPLPATWTTVARKIEGWPVRARTTEEALTEACAQLAVAEGGWSRLDDGEHLVWTLRAR
jgi:hypothetical protein